LNQNSRIANSDHSKPNCFVVPGKILLNSNKFKIISNDLSLDRIEKAFINADFLKNRKLRKTETPQAVSVLHSVLPISCSAPFVSGPFNPCSGND
jgi:hypothetical protein